ncbi:MAG: tRNA lysidine(34) synthetase TilS [Chitinophagales bacterium]
MDLVQRFREFVEEKNLFQKRDKLLLAVSGGLDSVVLCILCSECGYDFLIAHANFQLRGEESFRDEKFVCQLADKLQKEVLVKRFETEDFSRKNKLSIQAAARKLRYDWFEVILGGGEELRNQSGLPDLPKFILTAHHQDDNTETHLMNFLKGTGISGLRGIRPRMGNLIRPLLFAWKDELKEFAMGRNLQWVEDRSNAENDYSRNFLRNKVIPLIRELYPNVSRNLADNITRFEEIDSIYQKAIQSRKKDLLEVKGEDIHIPILKLKKSGPVQSLLYELLKDYHFLPTQISEITQLLGSPSGKYIVSSTHRILKNRNWLIISPIESPSSAFLLIEQENQLIKFELGELQLSSCKPATFSDKAKNDTAQLDAALIQFPLILRKWKKGDYFYPLGMRKKKKLSRFFIDQKFSMINKERAWVLEMDQKIIWIIGWRIDDRFKVTPSTKQILKIKMRVT